MLAVGGGAYLAARTPSAHPSGPARAQVRRVGQGLFHDNQARIARLGGALAALAAPGNAARFDMLDKLLGYIESGPGPVRRRPPGFPRVAAGLAGRRGEGFFAGHGATRKLSSGRDLGYIVPVDSDPNQFATDAIPMTEIQNIAESLTAKHALFVMDACYSGLGLTRGGGSGSFLRDNAKRVGRQMLTAGGGDQLVADGGPNGHSVFTWTLLQGLAGKADLNGDGLITATELAAYVAPAVASVSNQTPAFGSLPNASAAGYAKQQLEKL